MKPKSSTPYYALIVLLVSASACASPNIAFRQQNSAYFATASNPEDRSYNCSGTVTASYLDYGTPKTSTINVSFVVPAKANNLDIWNWQTSYTTSGLTFSPNINCN